MARDTVSVIVPTYNSSGFIGDCLKSILDQSVVPDEIIVSDGGSTDSTVSMARGLGVTVIEMGANRCLQRNAGADKATGTYLLFVDSDMRLQPGVVEDCLRTMKSTDAALVIPEVFIGDGFWAKVRGFERSFYEGVWYLEAARWYRRDQFLEIGGFDPRMVGPEDWELDQRVRKFGEVRRVSAFIEHNEGNVKFKRLLQKKAHYAGGFPLFKQVHPKRASLSLSVTKRIQIFLGKPAVLLSHPVLSCGVIVLGIAEAVVAQDRLSRRFLKLDAIREQRQRVED